MPAASKVPADVSNAAGLIDAVCEDRDNPWIGLTLVSRLDVYILGAKHLAAL